RLLSDLLDELAAVDVAGLVTIGGVERPNLVRFLDAFQVALERVADAVADVHFASGPPPRPLGSLGLSLVSEAGS
ncbi:hypothetical protein ACFP8W_26260, partial [Nocardioides hankookensis]